jgi:phospholipase/carboxylesterase
VPSPRMSLLVLLHGFEDDPGQLSSVAPRFGIDPARTTVIAPRGPLEAAAGPSWFPDAPDDPAALAETLDELDDLVDATTPDRREVIVGGFSQGGAMALALGLRSTSRPPLGATFAVSGYLLAPDLVSYDFAGAAHRPVLISHGAADAVVPVEQGRSAARLLERRGVPVRYCEHPGLGHRQEPAYLDDVRDWLGGLPG